MTESEVITVIDNVANRLARRFKFGYHSIEDMAQQARLFAWEGLVDYNGKHPLENYLWIHVRNRLCNFKRDNYMRFDGPCETCRKRNRCDEPDKCKTHIAWHEKQIAKINVEQPLRIDVIDDEGEQHMFDNINVFNDILIDEVMDIVDREIPINMRADLIKLRRGLKVSKHRKAKLQWILQTILLKHGYIEEARKIKS